MCVCVCGVQGQEKGREEEKREERSMLNQSWALLSSCFVYEWHGGVTALTLWLFSFSGSQYFVGSSFLLKPTNLTDWLALPTLLLSQGHIPSERMEFHNTYRFQPTKDMKRVSKGEMEVGVRRKEKCQRGGRSFLNCDSDSDVCPHVLLVWYQNLSM